VSRSNQIKLALIIDAECSPTFVTELNRECALQDFVWHSILRERCTDKQISKAQTAAAATLLFIFIASVS
jgi:hypothetical protein